MDNTRQCLQCHGSYTFKSKKSRFCSEKCKSSHNRDKRTGGTVTSLSVNRDRSAEKHGKTPEAENDVTVLTETDISFQKEAIAHGMGEHWLNFTKLKEEHCWECNRPFMTHLALLRYCSSECRSKAMGKADMKLDLFPKKGSTI